MRKIAISPVITTAAILLPWAITLFSQRVFSHPAPLDPNQGVPLEARELVEEAGMVTETNWLAQLQPQLVINQRAITVVGQGMATAPADTARLQLIFTRNNPFGSSDATGLSNTSMLARENILQPVVKALTAIKVPAEAITVQISSVESAEMQILIEKPTPTRVQEVVLTADRTAKTQGQLFLQNTGAQYLVRNCLPLENTARRNALADAQNRVRSLALSLAVQLSELLFATEFPVAGTPHNFSACGSKVAATTSRERFPPYDPAAPTEVQIRSSISLTYGIKPSP